MKSLICHICTSTSSATPTSELRINPRKTSLEFHLVTPALFLELCVVSDIIQKYLYFLRHCISQYWEEVEAYRLNHIQSRFKLFFLEFFTYLLSFSGLILYFHLYFKTFKALHIEPNFEVKPQMKSQNMPT